MVYLYFKDNAGKRTLIKSDKQMSVDEAYEEMHKYLNVDRFPYIRMWKNSLDETMIDYGSWSTFFILSNLSMGEIVE